MTNLTQINQNSNNNEQIDQGTSTKGNDEDKKYIIDECNKWNIDYQRLYKSGIYLTNLDDIDKVSLNGLKKYNYNGNKVESSYIQISEFKDNENIVNLILDKLVEYRKVNNIAIFAFIVHDMINFKTRVYKIKENTIDTIDYKTYTSRGTTIMPSIEKELEK